MKALATTAPKKTWGGDWFPQSSFFVATFVSGGQVIASKAPRFLAAKRCSQCEKRRMRTLTVVLILLTLSSCSDQSPDEQKETEVTNVSLDTTFISQQKTINQDSIDFLTAITSLENIQFYIAGQDSIAVTTAPTDLIELNTTKSAFHSSFAQSDTGLTKFRTVDLVRKYHVERKDDKTGANPSANIIQLTFKDAQEASDWFDIYDKSPQKKGIQAKPKTEIWLDKNHVYFVQTYHTPHRDYVNLLKKTITEKMKK